MKIRKFACVVCVVAVAILVASPAFAGGGGKHKGRFCYLDGSWMGPEFYYSGLAADFGSYSTYTSHSFWRGTVNMQWIARFAEWGPATHGVFTAVSGTDPAGVWKRTGRRTFEYRAVTFALDEDGAPVGKTVSSGKLTVSEDCHSLEVLPVSDFFVPGTEAEPWVRAEDSVFPGAHVHFPPMVYTRMEVGSICEEEH